MNRQEQKAKTRRTLIDVTLHLSAARGFSSLSIREIAKEAKVTPNAFYRHFRDLDELALVLVDEVGVGLRQLMRETRRRYEMQKEAARASVEAFMLYVTENVNLFRLLLGERQGSSTEFRRALHNEIDRFVGELTEDLERQGFSESALAAEAMVAAVFTIGAEALDLPKHRRQELTDRLTKVLQIILRGAKKSASH